MGAVSAVMHEEIGTWFSQSALSGTVKTQSALSVYSKTIFHWETADNPQPARDQEMEPGVIIKREYMRSKWLRLSIVSGCVLGASAVIMAILGSGGMAWGLGAWSIAIFGLPVARIAWMIDRDRIIEKESGARSVDKECSTF